MYFFFHCPTMQRNSTYHIPVYRVHCTQYTHIYSVLYACVCVCVDTHSQKKKYTYKNTYANTYTMLHVIVYHRQSTHFVHRNQGWCSHINREMYDLGCSSEIMCCILGCRCHTHHGICNIRRLTHSIFYLSTKCIPQDRTPNTSNLGFSFRLCLPHSLCPRTMQC